MRHAARPGRIALARGNYIDAQADAEAITAFANSTDNNELYFHGVALMATCQAAQGRAPDALRTSEDFLSRWYDIRGMAGTAPELCGIGLILATADRHEDIRAAALLLPESARWRQALLAIADSRYADAATLYEQIGSQPLAADAHLLAARQAASEGRTADAHRHAEAILAFAKTTGATFYQSHAEALVKASA